LKTKKEFWKPDLLTKTQNHLDKPKLNLTIRAHLKKFKNLGMKSITFSKLIRPLIRQSKLILKLKLVA